MANGEMAAIGTAAVDRARPRFVIEFSSALSPHRDCAHPHPVM
jgi:hypothetical protein